MTTIYSSSKKRVSTNNEYILAPGCDFDEFVRRLPEEKIEFLTWESGDIGLKCRVSSPIHSWFRKFHVFPLEIIIINVVFDRPELLTIDSENLLFIGDLSVYSDDQVKVRFTGTLTKTDPNLIEDYQEFKIDEERVPVCLVLKPLETVNIILPRLVNNLDLWDNDCQRFFNLREDQWTSLDLTSTNLVLDLQHSLLLMKLAFTTQANDLISPAPYQLQNPRFLRSLDINTQTCSSTVGIADLVTKDISGQVIFSFRYLPRHQMYMEVTPRIKYWNREKLRSLVRTLGLPLNNTIDLTAFPKLSVMQHLLGPSYEFQVRLEIQPFEGQRIPVEFKSHCINDPQYSNLSGTVSDCEDLISVIGLPISWYRESKQLRLTTTSQTLSLIYPFKERYTAETAVSGEVRVEWDPDHKLQISVKSGLLRLSRTLRIALRGDYNLESKTFIIDGFTESIKYKTLVTNLFLGSNDASITNLQVDQLSPVWVSFDLLSCDMRIRGKTQLLATHVTFDYHYIRKIPPTEWIELKSIDKSPIPSFNDNHIIIKSPNP